MKIQLKSSLLLIRKHKNAKLAVDMAIEENDEDKGLITGEVLESGRDGVIDDTHSAQWNCYKKGETVIFGRYALLKLTLKGENYHILDIADVLGTVSDK